MEPKDKVSIKWRGGQAHIRFAAINIRMASK